VLWYSWLGGRKGIRPVKKWGDGGGGHWLVRMEWRPAGWLVCLPLLIFYCTIKSRSSLLAPAHPGGPGKRAAKRLCVCVPLSYWKCHQWVWQVQLSYWRSVVTRSLISYVLQDTAASLCDFATFHTIHTFTASDKVNPIKMPVPYLTQQTRVPGL